MPAVDAAQMLARRYTTMVDAPGLDVREGRPVVLAEAGDRRRRDSFVGRRLVDFLLVRAPGLAVAVGARLGRRLAVLGIREHVVAAAVALGERVDRRHLAALVEPDPRASVRADAADRPEGIEGDGLLTEAGGVLDGVDDLDALGVVERAKTDAMRRSHGRSFQRVMRSGGPRQTRRWSHGKPARDRRRHNGGWSCAAIHRPSSDCFTLCQTDAQARLVSQVSFVVGAISAAGAVAAWTPSGSAHVVPEAGDRHASLWLMGSF